MIVTTNNFGQLTITCECFAESQIIVNALDAYNNGGYKGDNDKHVKLIDEMRNQCITEYLK